MCGKGTRCEGGQCIIDYSQDVCASSTRWDEEDYDRTAPVEVWGACDRDPKSLPAFEAVDDSGVAAYDPNAATVLDMNAGSERLSDDRLMAEMAKIEHKINECLSLASCYNGGLPGGTIDFQFRIQGKTGRVDGVNVKTPEALNVYGVVPCTRKVIWDYTFPKFNGQQMVVNYAIELD